ncbi:MAG: ATP synthase subunit I [Candidatus Fournierella pullistercoris]|uniref:ATP synthase subunit I n=1 Tax=Candidatus Allofournierella pullistercoris TaxID=2838597 RepID=A0A948WRX2_9FIRM|nr:ATP synthase subunit I [Candidatus Fournierella pullistercoris]
MKVEPAVKQETLRIGGGTLLGVIVMLGVFALLGKFSMAVLISGVLGGIVAVLNFFLLGLTVQKAANSQEDQARKWMQFSYNTRMFLMVVWLMVAIAVPALNWVAGLIPLLMPRLTIGVMQITGKYPKDTTSSSQQEKP